jgi:hypothetical protein
LLPTDAILWITNIFKRPDLAELIFRYFIV